MNKTFISMTNECKSFPLIEQVRALINDATNASMVQKYEDKINSTNNEYCRITVSMHKAKTKEEEIELTKELISYFRRIGLPEYYILYCLMHNDQTNIYKNLEEFVYNMMIDVPFSQEKNSNDYSGIIKFKKMVRKINILLMGKNDKDLPNSGWTLQWIYDYPSCNKYAQAILDLAELKINHYDIKLFDEIDFEPGLLNYRREINTFESRITKFMECCTYDSNKKISYEFIFWALLILAVDKTDAEKHLSVICNFCIMFGITEKEFEDLIHVVKEILHEETIGYRYNSETVQSIFGSLINQNRVPSDTSKTEYGTTGGHEMNFDAMLEASFSEVKKEDDIPKKGFFGGKRK